MTLKEKVISNVSEKQPTLPLWEVTELVERAEEFFLAETNRISVPKRAFWLWVDLSLEIHKMGTGQLEKVVSAIKRGDTNITFADTNQSSFPSIYSKVTALRVVRMK